MGSILPSSLVSKRFRSNYDCKNVYSVGAEVDGRRNSFIQEKKQKFPLFDLAVKQNKFYFNEWNLKVKLRPVHSSH